MVREDLVAGLRNALERGFSLEQAVQSFVSAGYSANDVEEAAQIFGGVSSIISPRRDKPNEFYQSQQLPHETTNESPQSIVTQQVKKLNDLREVTQIQQQSRGGMWVIVVLIVFLLLLVGALVWFILSGEEFLDSLLAS